eukprot:1465327-Prymnesium_polylepis.1
MGAREGPHGSRGVRQPARGPRRREARQGRGALHVWGLRSISSQEGREPRPSHSRRERAHG